MAGPDGGREREAVALDLVRADDERGDAGGHGRAADDEADGLERLEGAAARLERLVVGRVRRGRVELMIDVGGQAGEDAAGDQRRDSECARGDAGDAQL